MNFITINDGMVTGIFNGDIDCDLSHTEYADHERIAVQDQTIISGEPVSYYDKSWLRYSNKELIDKGLLELPKGYKLEADDTIDPMTEDELTISGSMPLPKGKKIENGKVVDMTQLDKLNAGLISQAEFDEFELMLKKQPLLAKLEELDNIITPRTLREAALGNTSAIEKIKSIEAKADELRKQLADFEK